MIKPVRIQLSRKAGFNLQAHSIAINGLPAVKVDRASIYGNPFKVHGDGISMTPEMAVAAFRALVEKDREWFPQPLPWPKGKIPKRMTTRADVAHLRGKNLACWCALDAPCHADVLLNLANRPICEAV